jgi:hypothetical protein
MFQQKRFVRKLSEKQVRIPIDATGDFLRPLTFCKCAALLLIILAW